MLARQSKTPAGFCEKFPGMQQDQGERAASWKPSESSENSATWMQNTSSSGALSASEM